MFARVVSAVAACWLLAARAGAGPSARAGAGAASTADVVAQATLLHSADRPVTRLGVLFGENDRLEEDKVVFFILSDVDDRGQRLDYGLYALTRDLQRSNRSVTTKILDGARDIAVLNLSYAAYFAAKDGIYVYNKEKISAEKYGAVDEEVVSVAAENGTGALYYLNRRRQLYKVTEGGRKSTVVDEVRNAEEIAVDYSGHMYYYTGDKKVYVYDGHRVREVDGVPGDVKEVRLVRTPVLAGEYGFVIADEQWYTVLGANATAQGVGPTFATSALSVDAGLVAYFAADNKIYEFNILAKIVEGVMDELSDGLKRVAENMRNSFNSIYA